MNQAGEFFAAKAMQGVLHHSSFLAGGAVAAAGELGLNNGQPTVISNESGHYQPGPAYMWQALRQMQHAGVNMSGLQVELHGCQKMSGRDFLENFDPTAPTTSPKHLSFDEAAAVAAIQAWQGQVSP